MSRHAQFDVIVIGSGITGGWAAKELTEQGLKVLMIERGRHIEHAQDYKTETVPPWQMPFRGFGDAERIAREYFVQSKGRGFDEWTLPHYANDRDNPYSTPEGAPFQWTRGYQLGGKSLIWGRQAYRWSDVDFGANRRDGHGNDWPIRYDDLAPWYSHVERFIGVSGSKDGLPQLPDGEFQPPMALNVVEAHAKRHIEERWPDRRLVIGRIANLTEGLPGRAPCQNRSICARGCSYGAYFSTQSSTLPAARATGNLTLLTDHVVERIDVDPATGRATGVRAFDTHTRRGITYTARTLFLCAGTLNSIGVLLRSSSGHHPNGLANGSGTLGRYLLDHANGLVAMGPVPGFEQHTTFGNRPTGIIVPRFRNVGKEVGKGIGGDANTPPPAFTRGYSYQGGAWQLGWPEGGRGPGLGEPLKRRLRGPGQWMFALVAFAETLPNADNRVSLHPTQRDALGLQQLHIDMRFREGELAAFADAATEGRAMLESFGGQAMLHFTKPGPPGTSIHEMGGARMGNDPHESVVDAHNRAHEVPNLYVTDGACMASSACQNPSLTYMALTARAARHAVDELKAGRV
jgi:choline dehydrogenase-like flavoprotein